MPSLKSQSSLKHPQTHTVLPSPLCLTKRVRGTISQEKNRSPWLSKTPDSSQYNSDLPEKTAALFTLSLPFLVQAGDVSSHVTRLRTLQVSCESSWGSLP